MHWSQQSEATAGCLRRHRLRYVPQSSNDIIKAFTEAAVGFIRKLVDYCAPKITINQPEATGRQKKPSVRLLLRACNWGQGGLHGCLLQRSESRKRG